MYDERAMRCEVRWIDVPGARLHAWFVQPTAAASPWPTVVMSHGWGAVKEMTLDATAADFARHGLASVVFDHRGFGGSSGPRGSVDPEQQVLDYVAVLGAVAAWSSVDADRLAVWGTSFSGGHVLCVGAFDCRVRAVVAQVPTISGGENTRRRFSEAEREALHEEYEHEHWAVSKGHPPRFVPAIPGAVESFPPDRREADVVPAAIDTLPAAPAEVYGDDSERYYSALGPVRLRTWANRVTLLSRERYAAYEPGDRLPLIAPTPLLVIAGDADTITPYDQVVAAVAKGGDEVRLVTVAGGHYEPYASQRPLANSVAAEFFTEHLL